MVVSAQLRLGGFYALGHAPHRVGRRDARRRCSRPWSAPPAALSAVLANDIVCLAVAPLLVEGCLRRGLDAAAVPAGARLRGERRLGGDADRQPAEHADRADAAALVRAASCADALRAGARSGSARSGLLIRARACAGRWASDRAAPAVAGAAARRVADGEGPRGPGAARARLPVRAGAARGAGARRRGGPADEPADGLARPDRPRRLAPARAVHRPLRRQPRAAADAGLAARASASLRAARRRSVADRAVAVPRHRACSRTSSRTCPR